MFEMFIFCLCLWCWAGVFGADTDVMKSVSVTEGDSVSLLTDVTNVQKDDLIMWMFGHKDIPIAQINRNDNKNTIFNDNADGRFRGRLQLDQTGSLSITNTRTTDSGLYKVTSIRTKTSLNTFNLTVYAHLPVHVISIYCPKNPSSLSGSSSGSKCAFLCSVFNVSDVTLSWYKGNSLLSSISVSDLSRSLSLHLECLDDSYSSVVSNSISNQTQHLDLSQLTCSDCGCFGSTEAVIRLALSALVGVAAVAVLVYEFRSRSLDITSQSFEMMLFSNS
ncbi:uncharacterized protein LOC131530410 isoform X1 [Onychostoma macrolepis]|uniref:uncharacterized protein LOC131530410 isoform X1 n=1 Tax=Onychostoma macrolepis TaxID=369639 RepID=UPI00272A6E04|nr:uncharacterized protein LOC131530410 isoform X1 [Onychostoma macrolepis]